MKAVLLILDLLKRYTPFIADFVARFFSKRPKFFATLQYIAAGVAILSYGLSKMQEAGMVIPATFAWLSDATVTIAGVVAAVMAQLPVPNPEPAKDEAQP